MNRKSCILLLVLLAMALNGFSLEGPQVDGVLSATFGINFDYEEVRLGLSEKFQFDISWPLLPYTHIASSGENEKFRMETSFTGFLEYSIENQSSGWEQNPAANWTINFSDVYSRIYFDRLYFLVGASETNYERLDGYNLISSSDRIRANWAYLTSRVAWSYLFTPDYNISEKADMVGGIDGNQGSESSVGIGGDHDTLSWLFMFGTLNDWTVDASNRYDIGYNVSYTGISNLRLNQGAFVRYAEDLLDLGAGIGAEYSYPISNELVLKPNAGVDIHVKNLNDLSLSGAEIAYGLTLEWPGADSYGFLALQEDSRRWKQINLRYSGVTISGINYIDGDSAENDSFNLRFSALDPRDGGLVHALELAALLELEDVLQIPNEGHNIAFGLYVDYTFAGSFRPKLHTVMKTLGPERDFPVSLSVGIDYVGLPFAEFGLVYENDDLSSFQEKPGRILLSAKTFF
ncbi:hypothetical protein [Spirochaeta dissipatitropha]